MAIEIIVNDLDGGAFHTVESGTVEQVRAAYPVTHPVQAIITQAIADGTAVDTYVLDIDGDEFTTKVIAKF